MTKPCATCGEPKRPGHPNACQRCWILRQPLPVQVREARAALALVPVERRAGRMSSRIQPEGYKFCVGCQRFRRLDAFVGGSRCKPCAWVQSHEATVKRTYGLEAGEYEAMFAAQGQRCAICRNRQLMRALAVHHDHKTGAVRALLCSRCNHDLLGGAWDSPELLLRAWATQVGGWPLVEAVMRSYEAAPVPPASWPDRLRYVAAALEAMPELEPRADLADDPPPY
jgi:hypothetical protein